MGSCAPELLDDLGDLFAELRAWDGVAEHAPAVFYVGRQPFLHFHLLHDGRRRADVKGRDDWIEVDLPHPASTTRLAALRRTLRRCYAEKRPPRKDPA
ncbi:MAG TPA: hypothetical protein VL049_09905 [Candidatus Dormibacteraeota bacterium]|nr:hypothetical protein [Candidatus Dormibacteraeota bacterium]